MTAVVIISCEQTVWAEKETHTERVEVGLGGGGDSILSTSQPHLHPGHIGES